MPPVWITNEFDPNGELTPETERESIRQWIRASLSHAHTTTIEEGECMESDHGILSISEVKEVQNVAHSLEEQNDRK